MGYAAPTGWIEELSHSEGGRQHSVFHLQQDCSRVKDTARMRPVERPYSAARCRGCAPQAT